MQQEWILDEVVSEDYEDDRDYIKATVVDSAPDDKWHYERHSEATDAIQSVIENSDVREDDGHIRFPKPHIIPEKVDDKWQNPNQLTSDPEISDLCESENLNSWWLEKGRDPLKKIQSVGLGGGVSRRRAVSKSLYHISEYTNNTVHPAPVNQLGETEDHACIVVALGGGTGSGIVIDFAKELDTTQTHLFAVIPNAGETSNEKANAYAALSELEYAHLAGESPFETITLIPFLESLEDQQEDFEMGVVRTILAHQNGMQGGNLDSHLPPGSNNGPPDFPAFAIAAPYTILYDIRASQEAEKTIKGYLDTREDQLERERDLYTVVKKYLQESFPETVGETLESSNLDLPEGYGEQAIKLENRIKEDVRDTLLTQQVFDIAGYGDEVENIREQMNFVLENDDLINYADRSTDQGKARKTVNYIERVRARVDNQIKFDETEDIPNRLHQIVLDELDNVATRRDVLTALGEVTAANTESGLNEEEARLIREVIRDVVLDHEVFFLDTRKPDFEDKIIKLSVQAEEFADAISRLRDFRDDVVLDDLTDRMTSWREDIYEPSKRLQTIHHEESDATGAIQDLNDTIDNELETLEMCDSESQTEQISLSVDFDGLEGSGIAPLNDLLDKMDVEEIDFDKLNDEFQAVREAKGHHIAHKSGVFFGEDREIEFSQAAGNTGSFFEIQPNEELVDVEIPFNYRFNESKIERTSQIEQKKEDSKDSIVSDQVKDHFTENGSELVSYETKTPLGNDPVRLPENASSSALVSSLRRGLNDLISSTDPDDSSLIEDIQDLLSITELNRMTRMSESLSELRPSDRNPPASEATEFVYDVYIPPITDRITELDANLRRIKRPEDEEGYGVIRSLKILHGISDGPDSTDWDVPFPEAHPRDVAEETYGRHFADNYSSDYTIDFEREGGPDSIYHPYIQQESSEPSDIIGRPAHIGESDVIENQEEAIAKRFESSVEYLKGDPRIPIYEPEPEGSGDLGDIEYPHLRFRPIYLSPGFETDDNLSSKYDPVREVVENQAPQSENRFYRAHTFSGGTPDEITMVMFIGGIFLDNIDLAVEDSGYQDQYFRRYTESEFVGEHHSIGLGGKWQNWNELKMRSEPMNTDNYGVFVHRSKTRDIDTAYVDDIYEHTVVEDDLDAKELLLDMFEIDTFQSTIDHDTN